MLSYLYGYWYSDYERELQTITKQRRLRHLLHHQIVTSKLKLKNVKPDVKTGIWELEKHSAVPIPMSKKRKRF